MIQPRTIFSVTLKENLETLQSSIPRLLKYYPNSIYYLIARRCDVDYFSANLNIGKRLIIIDENSLISYDEFLQLYMKMEPSNISEESLRRLPWYYQQVLKIIFALKFEQSFEGRYPIVMFDADSILLKKIHFFHDENTSISFGSLSECHSDYFASLELIFGKFDYPKLGFTTQFFSTTLVEAIRLRQSLKCDQSSFQCFATSISKIVLGAALKAHGNIEGSKFSEQELFGLANQLLLGLGDYKQKPIFSFRSWVLNAPLTSLQMKILSLLGVVLLTYEKRHTFSSKKLRLNDFFLAVASDMKPQLIKYLRLSSHLHVRGK